MQATLSQRLGSTHVARSGARRLAMGSAASRATPRAGRRAAVSVRAFKTSRREVMLETTRRYIETWQRAGEVGVDKVAADLQSCVADRVLWRGDGVVTSRLGDAKLDGRQLLDRLAADHAAYEHLVYRPMVVAADEESGVAFAAIYFELGSKGRVVPENPPSGMVSSGYGIERLVFDEHDRIKESLLCRQMTFDEARALVAPGDLQAWTPAHLDEGLLQGPDMVVALPPVAAADQETATPRVASIGSAEAAAAAAGPEEVERQRAVMRSAIEGWVASWSSGSDLGALDNLLAPDVRMHDGYGLSGGSGGSGSTTSSSKEGMFSFSSRDEAKAAVARSHEMYDNRNVLLAAAVADSRRVGFQHWRSHSVRKGHPHTLHAHDAEGHPVPASSSQEMSAATSRLPVGVPTAPAAAAAAAPCSMSLEGLGMLVFSPDLKIHHVIEFTMRDYETMRDALRQRLE